MAEQSIDVVTIFPPKFARIRLRLVGIVAGSRQGILDNCQLREELQNKDLQPRHDPGRRLQGALPTRHPVPPMGHHPPARVPGRSPSGWTWRPATRPAWPISACARCACWWSCSCASVSVVPHLKSVRLGLALQHRPRSGGRVAAGRAVTGRVDSAL